MSEAVFDLCQIGAQGGTMAAPGTAAAATFLFPLNGKAVADLDRASQFPNQDRGRNSRNAAGQGFHGMRGSSVSLPFDCSFEDLQDILEMHWSVVAASGPVSTYYTRAFLLEVGTPTITPKTIQLATKDATEAQQRLVSALADQLTISFPEITAPGASPWSATAEMIALDREISAYTGSLDSKTGREQIHGHLTKLYEGDTTTAFASLSELSGSLKSMSLATNRNLRRRAYGGASDIATKFGFGDKTNGTFELKIGISSTAKTDFHDIWDVASPAPLGERRWRLQATGTGSKMATIDARVGIMAVPYDEADGERLFKVTGELVDDPTLDALAMFTLVNKIA